MRGERGPVQVLCCGALLLWGTRRSLVSEPASSQLGWQCPQLAREQRPQLISLFTALDSSLFCCFAHVLMPLTPPAGSPPGIPPTALSALPTSPDTTPTTHTHTHTHTHTSPLPSFLVSSPHSLPASLLQEPPGARPTLSELTIGTQTCVWLPQTCASAWVRLPAENGCSHGQEKSGPRGGRAVPWGCRIESGEAEIGSQCSRGLNRFPKM